jgi:hypothetical protein
VNILDEILTRLKEKYQKAESRFAKTSPVSVTEV